MMYRMLLVALMALPAGAMVVGCEDEIASERTVDVKDDGTVVKEETTVTEGTDGSVTKEETKSVDTPD